MHREHDCVRRLAPLAYVVCGVLVASQQGYCAL